MLDPAESSPRTRIVSTVGPSSSDPAVLRRLAGVGVSVFRLNFSHGTHEEHAQAIRDIRRVQEEIGRPVGILADLSGPKLRIGPVPNGAVELRQGDEFRLTSRPDISEERRASVTFDDIHNLVEPGRRILLDDGTVQMRVERIDGYDVVCTALQDSVLKSRKGLNLPGTHLPIPALTPKDRRDIEFALGAGVDFVALSFVRRTADLRDARNAMQAAGRMVPLIAKIEMAEALEVLREIVDYADGAMVARGDLGVEIPIEEVPAVQQRIIRLCNESGKPVITATQMLNSMIENPTPTRAEVTDVYNAIMQGTDAVMLSGETAAGRFPIESVSMMARIAREAEQDMQWSRFLDDETERAVGVPESICSAAVHIAEDLKLDAILCASMTGSTARRIARYRPKCRILTYSTDRETVNRLCLIWGVQSRLGRSTWEAEEEAAGESAAIINVMLSAATKEGLIRPGMRVVVTGGLPLGLPGSTNFLHVVDVKDSGA